MNWWATGDAIVLREVYAGRLWSVRPVTVVEDSDKLLALYVVPNCPWRCPVPLDGTRFRPRPEDGWRLVDEVWRSGTLRLTHPDFAASVWLFFDERGTVTGRYINLEETVRRSSMGFDYLDQLLDIVVSADRTSWHWKDEDEFEVAQERGIISRERAAFFREEGERVLDLVLRQQAPFDVRWDTWRPDPAWPIPALQPDAFYEP